MESKLEIEERLNRIELAISSMAQWLVQAQTGFSAQDAQGVERILRGESGDQTVTPEELDRAHAIAKTHHEIYVRLAPSYKYTPSTTMWDHVPENKKLLLVAVIAELLDKGIINDR